MDFDRTRSLQDLDGQDWGEPQFGSLVVTNVLRLRRVPLDQFTAEDLRLMLGQGVSLEYLVPLAIERLEDEPLLEGDFFAGDVLLNLTKVAEQFWEEHPNWRGRAKQVIERAIAQLGENIDDPEERSERDELKKQLTQTQV